jgi:hypothetical protein
MPLIGTDELLIARDGVNYKINASEIAALLSPLTGDVTITIANFRGAYEWEEVVVATGVIPSSRICIWLAPTSHTDENSPETIDLIALSGLADTDQITITATFHELTSGPIKLQWSMFND